MFNRSTIEKFLFFLNIVKLNKIKVKKNLFLQNLPYKYYDCGHSNYNSDYSSDKNAMYKRTTKVEVEKAMAPHSSTLTWKIPWTEEPGGLQSMGSLRLRYDWATSLSLFTFMHWRRKWQSTPVFLPGESQGRGSVVGCCLWGHQSRTWLKWLSSKGWSSFCHFTLKQFF